MASDDCEPMLQHPVASFYRRHWLLFHLLCYILTAVSSLAMLFHFPILCNKFKGVCPLYAIPVVIEKSDGYTFLDIAQHGDTNVKTSVWGTEKTCDYVFTICALSFIFAFIWCWFFCYCSGWDGSSFISRDQKWRVIPPATICSLLISALTLVSSFILSCGMYRFCATLKDSPVESCSKASVSEWHDAKNFKGFYQDASWSIAEAWLIFCGWLLQTIMLFVHCSEGPGNGYIKKFESSTKKRRISSLM